MFNCSKSPLFFCPLLLTGRKTNEHATALRAIAPKIITVPCTPNSGMRKAISIGKIIGPNPVAVHVIPVAIRRFSLKYVFTAKEFALALIPAPIPEKK